MSIGLFLCAECVVDTANMCDSNVFLSKIMIILHPPPTPAPHHCVRTSSCYRTFISLNFTICYIVTLIFLIVNCYFGLFCTRYFIC